MKKKLFLIIADTVLVGIVCIRFWTKKPAEQMLVMTYTPEYMFFGVFADAYTVQSG